jgi:hypothetical protein
MKHILYPIHAFCKYYDFGDKIYNTTEWLHKAYISETPNQQPSSAVP